MKSPRYICFAVALCLFVSAGFVSARADWPAYRGDNMRSAYTDESLKIPMSVNWTYTSVHAPQPAWSGPATRAREGFEQKHRVGFDEAYQLVAADGCVYFGSSADHKVYAIDGATGATKWTFFTGGPVRLAPALYKDRVYFGSDDGFVYCLKASDGAVIWQVRGGPNTEKLLGNEKMISRWPVRTGVLIDDGILYFGAGVFPHETVFLIATDAETGKVIWKNDTISQVEAGRNDFTPQGYLLTSDKSLFVPCGRALPVGFSRKTGAQIFRREIGWRGEAAGGLVGGTYALLADNQLYTGTQGNLIALDQEQGRVGFGWFPGTKLAVVGPMAYLATGEEIVAMDRTAYAAASKLRNSLDFRIKARRNDVRYGSADKKAAAQAALDAAEKELAEHTKLKIEPTVKWTAKVNCDAELVICENLVIAGGQDKIVLIDRVSGKGLGRFPVQGRAASLAIADGRLYAGTDTGHIYCFGSAGGERGAAVDTGPHPSANPYPRDELTAMYEAAAQAIVMETGAAKGYCLVVGAERGRLAYELAKRTDMKIVAVEPDTAKAAAARKALDAAGLYGDRVVIDTGELGALPYSNYFANLIVSDSLLLTGEIPGDHRSLARHLKPCGGAICLGIPANATAEAKKIHAYVLEQWLGKMQLGGAKTSETNGCWTTLVRGKLPGAGKWTHQYAESGNTACSDDLLLAGPLGLLWFGEPGPAPMVNRHNAAASPLAVNGRLFIQGENVVMAYDSYNAVQLWKRDMPGAMRTRLKGSECGNLAASDDSFFVAVGDTCLRLDAATGRTLATYRIPEKAKDNYNKWGYLAYNDGVIYGTEMTATGISKAVFAIDTASGKSLWRHDGSNIVNLTLAVGDGWVFFVDSSITAQQRQELLARDKSDLQQLSGQAAKVAEAAMKKLDVRLATMLDAKTGGRIWDKPVDVTDCSKIGIGGGELSAMYRDGIIVLCGANANGHYWRQFLSGEFSKRRLVVLAAKTGERMWAIDANYRHRPVIVGDTVVAEPWAFDLQTGKQKTRPHPLTGDESTWQFFRPGHHCGAISACPQMLLMRSGYTSYYDLRDDSGIRHFSGHRLGCWINAIAADGLALAPEASAGCVCLFPIVCSVALEPRPDRTQWGIYSATGENTPVRQIAVNLGAPGDQRDSDGTLWLCHPRPSLPGDRAPMGFAFEFNAEFADGGGFMRKSEMEPAMAATGRGMVFASGGRGIKRVSLPLTEKGQRSRLYTVKLYFADLGAGAGATDIKLQGKTVATGLKVARQTADSAATVVRQFDGVEVSGDLNIELSRSGGVDETTGSSAALCGVEVFMVPEVLSQAVGK